MTVPKVRLPRLSLRGKWNKLSAAMQFLVLIFLIGTVGVGVAYATSVTLSDGEWVGLGASAGRLEVSDLATDEVLIEDATFKVVDGLSASGVNDATPGSFVAYGGASGNEGGQLTLWLNADHDATIQSVAIDAYQDDLRFFSSDTKIYNKFTYNAGAVFNESGDPAQDLRVEGDTDTDLLFVDASADRVGISTSSPGATLDVDGTAIFSEDFRIESDNFPTAFAVDVGDDRVEMDGFISLDPVSLIGYFSVETVGSEQVMTVTHSYVGMVGVTDLDCVATPNGPPFDGTLLILHTGLSSSDVVTAINDADCSGNPGRPFRLAGDFAIGNTDTLMLIYWTIHDGAWHEISRSDN